MVATVDKELAQVASHESGTTSHEHAIALHAWLGLDGNIREFGQGVGACEMLCNHQTQSHCAGCVDDGHTRA